VNRDGAVEPGDRAGNARDRRQMVTRDRVVRSGLGRVASLHDGVDLCKKEDVAAITRQ
jgi:hypothetical protein